MYYAADHAAGHDKNATAEGSGVRRQRLTVLALQAVAVALYGIHLYVYWFLPPSPPDTVPHQASVETAWWGLWPVQYAAPWFVLLGGLALAGVIAAGWQQGQHEQHAAASARARWLLPFNSFSLPADMVHAAASARARWLLLGLLTAGLMGAFYAFPLAHTRWGDAFMLANGIAFPDAALRLTHSWQAPLDVFLHGATWRLLHGPLGWEDAVPAYRLLSPLAGLLYLLAALALGARLAHSHGTPPWLTYGLLATLGLIQLFFGYVENYAFAAAGVLAYLWLGLRVLGGHSPLWLAAVLLGVTNATHPSTVILAPSLVFLGWQGWRTGNKTLARSVVEIALPVLLIGGATFVWMEASGHGLYALLNTDRPGGGDASWFVPLWETSTRWERYTLFSWPHLRDWLNQQLLVAPVVLPALAVVGVSLWAARRDARRRAEPRAGVDAEHGAQVATVEDTPVASGADRQGGEQAPRKIGAAGAPGAGWFLGIAAGFYLLFTFVWNPDYGGQRDWDLFSLAALPTTVLLAVLMPQALPQAHFLRAGALPLLLVQGWHTAAWIFQNTLPWEWPD